MSQSRGLAANTINQQLAAVRRLAHEAADSGLLSPELAAGISRVKGVKQLGFRSGNWLSAEQSSEVLKHAWGASLRAKRDYAMLAILFGCGLRRSSGLATGLSWLCYFRALQLGEASRVAPVDKLSVVIAIALAAIFLGEHLTWHQWVGGTLIFSGAVVLAYV